MMTVSFPFYYLILEEFYVGKLVQPALSGPDDASLAVYAVCLLTAYMGSEELWRTEHDFFGFGAVRTSHLFLYTLTIFEFITIGMGFSSNIKLASKSEHF